MIPTIRKLVLTAVTAATAAAAIYALAAPYASAG
jgi:hypothetical protein